METILWPLGFVILVAFGIFMWGWWITYDEAERKLDRDLSWRELIFAALVVSMAPPASTLAVLAYVWWIMPEAKTADRTMIATRTQRPDREPEPNV